MENLPDGTKSIACLLALVLISIAPAVAQEASMHEVSGTVTDAGTGATLPGVNVVVKGTTLGTATDSDGTYRLEAPSPQDTLVFSFIGYEQQQVPINGRSTINVQLTSDVSALEEVVVVGYGTVKKKNLSGAVEVISSEVLESRPVNDIASALQGVVPNLNITNSSGRATDAPSINIRGFTSINGGSPLILVDGVPVSQSALAMLNPADVASVTVLKDASAAAIYGARAAYGVVLITTKEPQGEELTVNYSAYYGQQRITRRPEIVTDPLTVMKFKDRMATPWYNLFDEQNFAYGRKLQQNPSLPRVVVDPDNPNEWIYYGSTDWFDVVYRDYSEKLSQALSFSKRYDSFGFYVSGSALRDRGMLEYGNDTYNKYNLRVKLNFDATSWLTFRTNSSYSHATYDRPVYNDWLFFHNVNRMNSLNVLKNPDGTYTSAGAGMVGGLKEGGRQISNEDRYQTTLAAEAEVVEDVLSIKADFTYRYNQDAGRSYDWPIPYRSGPGRPLIKNGQSWVQEISAETRYTALNLYADFQQSWGVHNVHAVAGFNQQKESYDYTWTQRQDLISRGLPTIELATGNIETGAYAYDLTLRGVFYRFIYTLKDRYILEADGRLDGSSRFPEGDKYAFFPSASAAWIVSQEAFMRGLQPVLSNLKLRASYGSLGNQSVGGYYPYSPTMPSGKITAILDGEQPIAVYPPPLVSPRLTWERATTLNFGVDLGFFDQQLTATFDLYRRWTTGMITEGKTLPAVLGTGVPETNAADLVTKGWGLSLSWQDDFLLASSPFNYQIDANLSDNRTWITRFDNPNKYLGDYYAGYEIGTIWGLVTEGFFTSEEDIKSHADQTAVASYPGVRPIQPGDIKFRDLNGDGVIDDGDWTLENHGDYRIIGNSRPRYRYGFMASAMWKGVDVRVFFQGVGKRDYYPDPGDHYFWGIYAQPWSNVLKSNLNHWTPDDPTAYFPRPKSYVAETYNELGIPQTRYLQDASYLRLKNLTVGYTLPSNWTARLGIARLRLYASGENLYEWTALHANLDPEALDGRAYPFQRTYTVGVNVTL